MFVPSGNQKHTGEDSFPLKLDTQKKDIQKKYGLVLDPIRLGLPFNGPQKKKNRRPRSGVLTGHRPFFGRVCPSWSSADVCP